MQIGPKRGARTGGEMPSGRKRMISRATPLVGLAVAAAFSAIAGHDGLPPVVDALLPVIGLVVLMAVVFAAVYHADVIAHRTGEPYGTLVLTVAVTVMRLGSTSATAYTITREEVQPPTVVFKMLPGDVGYVPQGYGHYIENTGDTDLEIVLALNNATYQSISITAWLASNPDLLLATNFGVPASVFAKMPNGEVVMPEEK